MRLFRLLNLFCYFFFSFDGPNTVYCISTQKHLLCLLESSFLLVTFFFWSTTEFITVTAFLLLSLLFVSSEICIFFTLKSIIKHASLITPSSSHTTNTCTFRDFRVLQKNKKQKKKIFKKWKKIPSIFGVNVNLAVRSEYANAFLIGPNLHSLFVLRRVVKSTLQICLIYWCNIIDFAFVRKTRKPNNSY